MSTSKFTVCHTIINCVFREKITSVSHYHVKIYGVSHDYQMCSPQKSN